MNRHIDTRVTRLFLGSAVALSLSVTEARAALLGARVAVTGTTNATTAANVTQQTPGATLFVATDPSNTGDLTLLEGANTVLGGGTPLTQANGVIIAAPNQFQYTSVSRRNIIETPGELSAAIPAGFPSGMWLSTTEVAGNGAEVNFNLAMAYFRFADNWTAGHVNGADGTFFAGNTTGVTVTTQFDTPSAAFGTGHYTLSIAGVDSRGAGMLFAMSEGNNGSGRVVPVGILADGSGWDIRVNDEGDNFPATTQDDWSFVYIPYNGTENLVAAGNLSLAPTNNSTAPPTSVNVVKGKGTFAASLVDIGDSAVNGSIIPPAGFLGSTGADGLTDAGRILITIPGKDDTTGMLLVGVSKLATTGTAPNQNIGADDNLLAWEYVPSLGGFLVETMDLAGANLQNSDIYFAYFDYANPLAIPEPSSVALALLAGLGLCAVAAGRKNRQP